MSKNVMVRADGTRARARPSPQTRRETRTADLLIAMRPHGSSQEPEHLVECSLFGRNATRPSSVFARC
jgi:hypothetical protein